MRTIADELGFAFSRTGCPCNGSPAIYICVRGTKRYTLTIWEKRDYWTLKEGGYQIAWGNKENMNTKIKEIWD